MVAIHKSTIDIVTVGKMGANEEGTAQQTMSDPVVTTVSESDAHHAKTLKRYFPPATITMTLLKIALTLTIVMAFSSAWKSCSDSHNDIAYCSSTVGAVYTSCEFSGNYADSYPPIATYYIACNNTATHTISYQKETFHESGVTVGSYVCVNDAQNSYITVPTLSHCSMNANPCLCGTWLLFSFPLIVLNLALLLVQLYCIYVKQYDPLKAFFFHIIDWNWSWLCNPWNCFIALYDLSYLLLAMSFQFILYTDYSDGYYVSCDQTASATATISPNFFFVAFVLLLLLLKETFKINTFYAVQQWKEDKSIGTCLCTLFNLALTARFFYVMALQSVLAVISLVTVYPLVLHWNTNQLDREALLQKAGRSHEIKGTDDVEGATTQ